MNRQTIRTKVCKLTITLLIALTMSVSIAEANPDNDLIEATKRGDIDAVKTAVNTGANIETRDAEDKVTALMLASFLGYDEIVNFLVQAGANVNAQSGKDGWVPLMHASFANHLKLGEFLIASGANINAVDNDGDSALMQTSFHGTIEIVKMLLKHGADATIKDINGKTALDFAKEKGNVEIIALLEAYIALQTDQDSSMQHDDKLLENIQGGLKRLGYKIGSIDGKIGEKTIEAIKEFQNEHGLEATGKPSTALFTVISAYAPKPETPVTTPKVSSPASEFSCEQKYCKDIATCDEAYYLLNTCGYDKLDRDDDGVPCENVCQGG